MKHHISCSNVAYIECFSNTVRSSIVSAANALDTKTESSLEILSTINFWFPAVNRIVDTITTDLIKKWGTFCDRKLCSTLLNAV